MPHTLFVDARERPADAAAATSTSCSSAPTASPRNGDVCNKIGTYDKALAARDNGVPFYVALPSPTIDRRSPPATRSRSRRATSDEVLTVAGRDDYGQTADGRDRAARARSAVNYAFDVTPARLVTGLITERGVARRIADGLARAVSRAHAVSSRCPARQSVMRPGTARRSAFTG